MSRIYKVCIHGHPKVGTMEIFAIKPYLESFDNLKEEIFIRKPDLKNRDIRIYYTGKLGAAYYVVDFFFFLFVRFHMHIFTAIYKYMCIVISQYVRIQIHSYGACLSQRVANFIIF